MLVKVRSKSVQKIPRNGSRITYVWAERVDLKILVRVFCTFEHVLASCEKRLTKGEWDLAWASLVQLRKAIRQSAKGQQLLAEDEHE